MIPTNGYIFTSERLGFRTWISTDIAKLAEINADPEVMEFFPTSLNFSQTTTFVERMEMLFAKKGFCYFAVDKLEDNSFIGFIGLSEQRFEAPFTPCIDIGWRLSRKEWNKGYATEGAKACLNHAFQQLNLKKIHAIAPVLNLRSKQVMERIGMRQKGTFKHPLITSNERLETCFLYEINHTEPHQQ